MSESRLGSGELVMVKHKDDICARPAVWAIVEMDKPFMVRGQFGKPGDYLMRTLDGEYSVCGKCVFEFNYVRVDSRGNLYVG